MGNEAELEFVARLRDEATAAARNLRRAVESLGAPVRGTEIPVSVDADRAHRALTFLQTKLGGIDRASRAMGRGLLAIGRYGAVGLGVLGGVAGAGLAAGLKTAAGMETADIAFTTMLGSAGKADAFLRDLSDFAATTPFEFPELQTAASSLIASGLEARKVIPIMTTLGDVTSGMGTGSEGIQRATVALQQMSAAGRITGEDLNQLRDAGVPVFDLLAAATGRSKAEVAGLAQEGKLGAKDLAQLMKALETGKGLERFSGLMEKQSASLSGQWSTLKDNANLALAGMVEPILPLLKSGMAKVSAMIASGGDKFPKLVDDAKTVIGVIKQFGPLSDNAAGSLARFLGVDVSKIEALQGIARDISTVFRTALVPAIQNASTILPAFLAPLGLARVALGFLADHTTTAKVALTVLAVALLTVTPALKLLSAATTIATTAKTAYAIATGRSATAEQLATRAKIAGHLASVKSAASTVAHTAGIVAQTVASKLASGAAKAWAAAQWLLNAAMTANPIGLVVAAIALLVAGFVLAWKRSETFRDVVKGAMSAVQKGAGDAVGFMIDGFRKLLDIWLTVADGIISGAAKALGWIPGLGGKLKAANRAFDKMRAGIDSTLSGLADDARGWGDDVASGFASGISASSYKAINAAGGMANKVAAMTRAQLDSHSPSRVFEKLGKTVPDGFAKGILDGARGAVDAIRGIVEQIEGFVESKAIGKAEGDRLVDLVKRRTKALKDAARDRESAVARLAAAREKLAGLEEARSQLAGSVRDAAIGFGAIGSLNFDQGAIDSARSAATSAQDELTALLADSAATSADIAAAQAKAAEANAALSAAEASETVSATTIATKLEERKAQLAAFAANVETLRARGLNEASVQEIIAQGAEAGAASAAALAVATDAQLAQINGIAASITAQATALGESTASAMYDAGIKSARGIVAGIESEVASIDRVAKRLARRLVRQIKRELGIRSPSSVMADTFGEVPAGAALGILDGIPLVDRAASKLAASAARAATAELGGSMIPLSPVSIRATSGETITIRHEVTSPDGSISELDARTIAAMISKDPRAASALEAAVRTAGNRRDSATIGPSA